MRAGPVLAGAEAVLLDLYDTIAWAEWPALGGRLAERLGVDAATLMRAFDETRGLRGTGGCGSVAGDLAALAAACGVAVGEAFVAALASDTVADARRSVQLYDDVRPALRRLRALGVRLAVVSNCDHATRPVVDSLGLGEEVDAVVLSCEVGSIKPAAAIFQEALGRLRARPSGSVFVDDQASFLDGAASLGIRTLRMARRAAATGPGEAGGHPVIRSLGELVA